MSTERDSLVIPSAVYFGAAILIGIPVMLFVLHTLGVILTAVGREAVLESPVGILVLLAVSVLIGLQVAVEVAAVQLGGIEALGRGSPRVALARYLLFVLCVFVVLAATTLVGMLTVLAGVLARFEWGVIALGSLISVAGLLVLYRSSRAFINGRSASRYVGAIDRTEG